MNACRCTNILSTSFALCTQYSFFKQFGKPISEQDYLCLRYGFITVSHGLPLSPVIIVFVGEDWILLEITTDVIYRSLSDLCLCSRLHVLTRWWVSGSKIYIPFSENLNSKHLFSLLIIFCCDCCSITTLTRTLTFIATSSGVWKETLSMWLESGMYGVTTLQPFGLD